MSDVERTGLLVSDMVSDLRQSQGERQEHESGGNRPNVHDCTRLARIGSFLKLYE
jgi:hypothetical protein